MTARFTGARTVHERRRRRLACEGDAAVSLLSHPATTAEASSAPAAAAHAPQKRVLGRVSSLVAPELWKSWVLVAGALCLWLFAAAAPVIVDRLRPELSGLFGLRSGNIGGFFRGVSLLAACQLSFLILWHRTDSRKDFHGRYRAWIWSSLTWPTVLAAHVTGWHATLAARLQESSTAAAALPCSAIWLAPAAILVWTTSRLLLIEMASCGASRILLRMALAALAASLVVQELAVSRSSEAWIVGQGALNTLWPLLAAASLWHHARYVIHVTNEAAPLRQKHGRWKRFSRDVRGELRDMLPTWEGLLERAQPGRRSARLARGLLPFCRRVCRGFLAAMGWVLRRMAGGIGAIGRRAGSSEARVRKSKSSKVRSPAVAPANLVESPALEASTRETVARAPERDGPRSSRKSKRLAASGKGGSA
ncbi:MAG: hypothetical protein KF774_01090 [Planctomyces sp.]|nr:hypothetical protein [Planctomyces sp.]